MMVESKSYTIEARYKYVESPLEIKSGQQKRREKRANKRKQSKSLCEAQRNW